ncbi:hypothetical protein tb265_25390 [Gemmatimonadetes bacterium T265]|nr:hypothetical protein tb265_25390 [Gemmatimonadetes bacterium T265]
MAGGSTGGPRALHALLAGAVDYAGLFPPAGLAMSHAVRRYAADRRSAERWMLGRFVVPAARLEEFEAAALDLLPAGESDTPWRLSAVAGPGAGPDAPGSEPGESLRRAAAFNARHAPDTGAGRAVVDAVEWRAPDVAALGLAAAARARHLPDAPLYAELPPGADADAFARAAARAGLRLKLRTGGVTADAFPAPDAALEFLDAVVRQAVPSKVTAGLHHPLRGEHALTYEPGSARGPMFGFVNVLLAAALLRAGHAPAALGPLLDERDAGAFAFTDDAAVWRGYSVDAATIAAARADVLVGFGSCAFDEPVRDLRALGWLPD